MSKDSPALTALIEDEDTEYAKRLLRQGYDLGRRERLREARAIVQDVKGRPGLFESDACANIITLELDTLAAKGEQ